MAATPLPPFELAPLARFLTEASGAGGVEIGPISLLPGGAIQQNWGFTADFAGGCLGGTQHLVLRTDAPTGVLASLGRVEEFAVLQAAFAAGVTAPEPLFACADPKLIGKPFFVMRRLPGSAQGRQITTDPALEGALPAIAHRLGEELARLQQIRPPRPDLAFLPMVGPGEHIAACRAYLDCHHRPRPVLEWAIRWLETHLPAPLPPVLCHRDFRTGNYMLDGAAITGILDWEFAGWGDPDEDIGWFCCKGWRFARLDREAGGIAMRAPFYDGYESVAGRRPQPQRVRFWEVLANVRWAVIALQQSDRHLLDGAGDLATAIIGRRATECDLELLMLLDPDGVPAAGPRASGPHPGGTPAVPIRDLPNGAGLLALAREELLCELLPLLPPERERQARLIATAMAIAEREALAGDAPAVRIREQLEEFYDPPNAALSALQGGEGGDPSRSDGEGEVGSGKRSGVPHLTPALSAPPWPKGGGEGDLPAGGERESAAPEPLAPPAGEGRAGALLAALLRRLAADLRIGAFEPCEARARAARAVLWHLTSLKLREGNPQFLAANGFGE
jgi:aminoglycoside phosphotransferase (APT) family kinase protein